MASQEDLIQSINKIALEEEEETGYEVIAEDLDEQNQNLQGYNPKLCIVGRFIAEGKVEFLAMQHTMAALWKPGKGVYMKELDAICICFNSTMNWMLKE